MPFKKALQQAKSLNKIPGSVAASLESFFVTYKASVEESGHEVGEFELLFLQYLDLVVQQVQQPYTFSPIHKAVRKPFDYYRFGIDLLRPLVIFGKSKVYGITRVQQIQESLDKGENVILFANHQIEPDPQAISLLLEKTHPKLAEEMIFVAGHRVISDPLAVPFSMGRNLLCIFSKKYMKHPPEKKAEKQLHNRKTIGQLSQVMTEGGKCIYVAPSGGRDRPDQTGVVDVAPFDEQSIELFRLLGKQSGVPTHFYPLALDTYKIAPPPQSIGKELGEPRKAYCSPIYLAFGKKIDMDNIPHTHGLDKHSVRMLRAKYIWSLVKADYNMIKRNLK